MPSGGVFGEAHMCVDGQRLCVQMGVLHGIGAFGEAQAKWCKARQGGLLAVCMEIWQTGKRRRIWKRWGKRNGNYLN